MKIHNIIPAEQPSSKAAREQRYLERNNLTHVTTRLDNTLIAELKTCFPEKSMVEIVREAVALYASLYR